MTERSELEKERLKFAPRLPEILKDLNHIGIFEEEATQSLSHTKEIQSLFPHTYGQPKLKFSYRKETATSKPLRIGVVLSGGQAAGGHNVISGLFDAIQQLHEKSVLIGFLSGPSGIIDNKTLEITDELLQRYRNTGGFDLLGSGRTKIETQEQLEASLTTVRLLNLDGLVVVGGDDSNTNAAILAEFFKDKGALTKVIGVPKTIDGDLKGGEVEISFGFDTASKVYSEMIGNIARDTLSSKKYYHFIKLMGRSASHLTLECALQTHPNITLIGEEILEQKKTLEEITKDIADVIVKRAQKGINHGLVLIPEGLIEFIPENQQLFRELNAGLAKGLNSEEVVNNLSSASRKTFNFFPKAIAEQLLLDRDPHGNLQVSHIATEQLLIHTVAKELKERQDYKGKFHKVSHFFGYEGRSAFPSNFDSNYCYGLGYVAALLIHEGFTGYMSALRYLTLPPEQWIPVGIPLTMLMNLEERKGKSKPVIKKSLVDLGGEPYKFFVTHRQKWSVEDHYRFPGPPQYFGPSELIDVSTMTLLLEQGVEVT